MISRTEHQKKREIAPAIQDQSSESSFLRSTTKTVKDSIADYQKQYDMRLTECDDFFPLEKKPLKKLTAPDSYIARTLERLLAIWNKYSDCVVKSKCIFKRDKLEEIIESLKPIDKDLRYLGQIEPEFHNPNKQYDEKYTSRVK